MFEKLELTRMAQALAAHAGARMGVIAENVANADTPGFKARDIEDFATVFAAKDEGMRATRRVTCFRPTGLPRHAPSKAAAPRRRTATACPWKRKW